MIWVQSLYSFFFSTISLLFSLQFVLLLVIKDLFTTTPYVLVAYVLKDTNEAELLWAVSRKAHLGVC